MHYCFGLAFIIFILIVMYRAGRGAGYAEGRRAAFLEAPILAREEALRAGVCPVCGTTPAILTLASGTYAHTGVDHKVLEPAARCDRAAR